MSDERPPTIDRRRLTLLGLCLTFGAAVIAAQLVRYQVVMHTELKERANKQRTKVVEVPPPRGSITDAQGRILAMNVFQWEISASPSLVTNGEELADILAGLLDTPRDEIYRRLQQETPWVLIDRFVPQEIGEAINSLQADGLICTPSPLRIYPVKEMVAHILGIVNNTGDGFYGIEGYHNSVLGGISGAVQMEIDPLGEPIPLPAQGVRSPEVGSNLVLTVDLGIQHIALQELEKALKKYEAESGTVIVMDPKTGALLALASLPTYDPNRYATTEPSLLADPSVSSMWEPGSVFKIITWAAGLDSGVIDTEMTVYDKGKMEVGGRVIENSDRKAHGEVTMSEALARSLNTVAAYISTTMGKDRFYTYVRRFGFGSLTGVDLASEGPGRLKLPGDGDWFPSDLGTNSFGQGIAVTPLQMITAVAAVANEGQLLRPHVVQQFVRENELENAVVNAEPHMERQAISKEAAEVLTAMLVEAVDSLAPEARVPGYRIAGKTGTAEIPTAFGYHATDTIVSFVGYAPASDPEFIVLVKLDRPKTSRWAAYTAAPTFRSIAERLFVYLQIPPDDVRLAQQ